MSTLFRNYKYLGWFPVVTWCGLIFWMSGKSETPDPGIWLPPHFDKIVHAVIYAILSSFMYAFLRSCGIPPVKSAVLSVLFSSLYGITDEWRQSMVDNRVADIYDWIADTVGACIVFIHVKYEATLKLPFTGKNETHT
ncbi:MAG TPA: VanZ family protein [Kiritimatiellia bacterium]|nr:VanZ family protein [Kiritimatiellia bacterium]